MGPGPGHGTDRWDWDELGALALRETQRVLPSRYDAEDAAQEAIIRAYRSQSRCDNPAAPQSWIKTIARHEAYRLYAKRRDDRISEPDEVEPYADTTDELLEHLAAENLLRRVPFADRSLLVRRYVFDQSSAQIAAELALPAATVRVRLHRASKRLREQVDNRLVS
jgi:RNA polymerase sigma-70 factor (ECF subfamily)